MANDYETWKDAQLAERAYDPEEASTSNPQYVHHDEYDHQNGEKPSHSTAKRTAAKHVATGAVLGSAGTVAAGAGAAHYIHKNPHLKAAAGEVWKHFTGESYSTTNRAQQIREWFDTYGIKKSHSVHANAHYAQAHRKAHQAAHTEANRAAKEAGDKTWYATSGTRKEKKAAAHNAAGKAYHTAYGRTYGDIHAGMLRTLGRSKSPQKVLPQPLNPTAAETSATNQETTN